MPASSGIVLYCIVIHTYTLSSQGNIDSWGGPLPRNWITMSSLLQRQLLQRQRDFGMKPVLPAFAGHVPSALKVCVCV